jgi:hypothetical protein
MAFTRFLRFACICSILLLAFAELATSQTETGTVSGLVTDSSGAVVAGAEIELQSVDRGSVERTPSNSTGIYFFPSVQPGRYQITVRKDGFKQLDFLGLIVNVQAHIEQNFRLQLGSVSESITVEGSAPLIDTQSASVSTVVDRQFAENLPMNGRSFQSLIELTPGIVLTQSTQLDPGQFSVDGQRPVANYWMVDGVSANIGVGTGSYGVIGYGLGGGLPSFSIVGGTNSLVSVDAMQEFRIQSSTYAPEFGRTPGGQISIVTRSGTNQWHGTVFDYLRNGALDANDWFADSASLPKPQERQNDFGGTFSGPVIKDKTFFFFSYEGLRLSAPQVALTAVPDLNSRTSSIPAMQPFLNAYPLPNGPEILDGSGNPTGTAEFNASFSNPASLDAYSIRLDHKLNDKFSLFGRYDYSPSSQVSRGGSESALSLIVPSQIKTQTATAGGTWIISPTVQDDIRFNYSWVHAVSDFQLDNFGGAVPLASLPFPPSVPQNSGLFDFYLFPTPQRFIGEGPWQDTTQRQINIVDGVSMQHGSHNVKVGADYRRLAPLYSLVDYSQGASFDTMQQAETGQAPFTFVSSSRGATFLFRNLGLFAQDTWRITPRLTATYGLRWDFDFTPKTTTGPSLGAVTELNVNDLSQLSLAPAGSSAYGTRHGNIAPRIGIAYQILKRQDWSTVLRGGFGVFYDLASDEVGNGLTYYPFQEYSYPGPAAFPLDPSLAVPPVISPPSASNPAEAYFFDPHLKSPYTLQWSVGFEQSLGREQSITATYVGSGGRHLIQSGFAIDPNPDYTFVWFVTNAATSEYNALQLQFQRHLSHGLQALMSYTWSHSIDDASSGSGGNGDGNALILNYPERASSDFDIRQEFSAGLTYIVPMPKTNQFSKAILAGWSVQNMVQVRTAPPVDLSDGNFYQVGISNGLIRPDLVPGIPLYLYGSQYPGGKIFNNTPNEGGPGCLGPFCPPPVGADGNPLRQGDIGRNALRGFGAAQWDFAVHREFPIHESVRLQFRAELFNVLNHPNFAPPVGDISQPTDFGRSIQMLGQALGGQNPGGGGFSPLYQIGGPRSIQLALKLFF